MVFDTDVLIWVFRGNPKAARAIDADRKRAVSIITYMKLVQGVRNQQELRHVKRFLTDLGFRMLPLTENIGHRASIYMEEYALKVAMSMGDALIAATASEYHTALCTGNRKHYRQIQELEVAVFKP